MKSGRIVRALGFAILSAAAMLAASALDLETAVALNVLPGKVEWTVAGASLATTTDVADVTGFSITTRSGIFPAEIRSLSTMTGETGVTRWPPTGRPSRFDEHPAPVGDWWVDATGPDNQLYFAETPLGSDFTIEASFSGRYHQHTMILLKGSPGLRCSFRRGVLNNDLFILDEDGAVLASGSLPPELGDRLAAIMASVARAIGGAALLVALWSVLAPAVRPQAPESGPAGTWHTLTAGILVVAAAAAALSGWTATVVLDALPHQPDEVVYRLQSEWILSGRLAGLKPPCPEHFEIPFTYFRGDRWIGHYPPAWPVILSPGVALGFAWLVPVLLRFPFVVLVGLVGTRIGGQWVGIGAALLASTSPLATLLFASILPHAGSATLLLLAVYLCLVPETGRNPIRSIAAGAAVGIAFAIRPLTAIACAVPLGLYLLQEAADERRTYRALLWVPVGGILALCPALAANAIVTGSPWRFPYSLAQRSMVSPDHLMYGIRNVDTILASLLPLLQGWGWPWLSGPVLLALPLAFAGVLFVSGCATREDKLLLWTAVSVLAIHALARANGLHGFGPRYAFAACAPLWILTARGASHLARIERRRFSVAGVALALLIASAALTTPARMMRYRGYNDVSSAPGAAIAGLPPCSIVLLPEDNWRGWAFATPWIDPNVDEAPLFALDLEDNTDLESCFPDRGYFRLRRSRLQPIGRDQTDATPYP